MVHSTWHTVGAQWIFVLFLSLALWIPAELSGGGEQLCPGRHQPWLLAFDPAFAAGCGFFLGKEVQETWWGGKDPRAMGEAKVYWTWRSWPKGLLLAGPQRDGVYQAPPTWSRQGPTGLGSRPPQPVRQDVFPPWPLITRQWALSAFCTCFLFWEAMNNETMENSDCGCIFHITSLKRVNGQTSDTGTCHPLKILLLRGLECFPSGVWVSQLTNGES